MCYSSTNHVQLYSAVFDITLEFFPILTVPALLTLDHPHTYAYVRGAAWDQGSYSETHPTLSQPTASHLFSVGTGNEGVLHRPRQRAALEVEQGKDAMVEVSS